MLNRMIHFVPGKQFLYHAGVHPTDTTHPTRPNVTAPKKGSVLRRVLTQWGKVVDTITGASSCFWGNTGNGIQKHAGIEGLPGLQCVSTVRRRAPCAPCAPCAPSVMCPLCRPQTAVQSHRRPSTVNGIFRCNARKKEHFTCLDLFLCVFLAGFQGSLRGWQPETRKRMPLSLESRGVA